MSKKKATPTLCYYCKKEIHRADGKGFARKGVWLYSGASRYCHPQTVATPAGDES